MPNKSFIIIAVLTILCVTNSIDAFAGKVTEIQAVDLGKQFSIDSKILNETRQFTVYLPTSYNNNMYSPKDYPVLYMLDGEWYFRQASMTVEALSSAPNFTIPEMIVVAIHNTHRDRDMTPTHSKVSYLGKEKKAYAQTGGANQFLNFIDKELKPHIDKSYRTNQFSVLSGHSIAGLFVLHTLVERPNSFNAFIVIDPSYWWDNDYIYDRFKKAIQSTHYFVRDNNVKANLIITTAAYENYQTHQSPHDHLQQANQFEELFTLSKQTSIDYKRFHFKDESHGSVAFTSLYHGLKHLFRGHNLSLADQYDTPERISERYNALSSRLGVSITPNEAQIDALGCEFLTDELIRDAKKAEVLFSLNAQYYPDSFHAWHSLGEAQLAQQKLNKAQISFSKSVDMNPQWQYGIDRLAQIEKSNK